MQLRVGSNVRGVVRSPNLLQGVKKLLSFGTGGTAQFDGWLQSFGIRMLSGRRNETIMSMSTHVVGYRVADAKWAKMKAAWEACEAAGVPAPADVIRFFEGEDPGDKPGMEVSIKAAVTDWGDAGRSGYQIDVTKLPPDVKVLRFYNCW